jgi:hypothetical protein
MPVFIIPVLAAIGVAGTPQVLNAATNITKGTVHLLANWYGVGLVVFVLWKRPAISCTLTLDEWGQTVLRRVTRSLLFIWAGFYLCHVLIWIKLFDITFTILHIVSGFLLAALVSKIEAGVWLGGFIALAVTLVDPSHVSLAALAVGLVCCWKAWHLHRKRLYVGVVLAFYISVWTLGWQRWPLPEFNLWLSLVTAVILVVMAWRLRLRTALLPLILGLYPVVIVLRSLSVLGWGILLLAIGFIALIVGIMINWLQRHPQANPPETKDTDTDTQETTTEK